MNSNDKLIALLKCRFAGEDPEYIEKMCGIVDGYEPEYDALLACMVGFIETVVVVDGHESKLSGGYTGQPPGCLNVLTLTYGRLGKVKMTKWIARIYFTDDGPRIAFPDNCRLGSRDKVYRGSKFHPGTKKSKDNNAFSPKDTKDFFRCPDNYLDWKKLEEW